MINPYDFLGVTDKSSLKDLRKAYYNLSLVMHPDKGGDSTTMIILHNAYKYIKEQFENINEQPDSGKSYEELQTEFENYINKQESINLPSILNVISETLGITQDDYSELYERVEIACKLKNIIVNKDAMQQELNMILMNQLILKKYNLDTDNDDFENKLEEITKISKEQLFEDIYNELFKFMTDYTHGYYSGSIVHGYGNEMVNEEKSINADIDEELNKYIKSNLNTFVKGEINNFENRQLIIHKDQNSHKACDNFGADIILPKQLNDYSVHDNKNLELTDYKLAYSSETPDLVEVCKDKIELSSNILIERIRLDEEISNTIKEYDINVKNTK